MKKILVFLMLWSGVAVAQTTEQSVEVKEVSTLTGLYCEYPNEVPDDENFLYKLTLEDSSVVMMKREYKSMDVMDATIMVDMTSGLVSDSFQQKLTVSFVSKIGEFSLEDLQIMVADYNKLLAKSVDAISPEDCEHPQQLVYLMSCISSYVGVPKKLSLVAVSGPHTMKVVDSHKVVAEYCGP